MKLLTDEAVRLCWLERRLRAGTATAAALMDEFMISPATLKRDLRCLRLHGAVIVYDCWDRRYVLRNAAAWSGVLAMIYAAALNAATRKVRAGTDGAH